MLAGLKHNKYVRLALAGPLRAKRALVSAHRRSSVQVFRNLDALIVDDVKMFVPGIDAAFWISPKSDLFKRVIYHGDYEPDLLTLFLEHIDPDADVIDIGANIGFYTVAIARKLRGGRVLAIEPTAAACDKLRRNIEMNGVNDRVIVAKTLISDSDAMLTINVIAGREEYSTMGDMVHPNAGGNRVDHELVEAVTLDALVARHQLRPKLIKVDVEGAEGKVFAGARETIARHRPIVLSELTDILLRKQGSSSAEIVAFFSSLDYDVVDPQHPSRDPSRALFADIYCVPRERKAELEAVR